MNTRPALPISMLALAIAAAAPAAHAQSALEATPGLLELLDIVPAPT